MRLKRTLIFALAGLLAAALIILLTPLIMASGLRFWAQRVANREGLQLQIERIDAPLLGPVTVENLRIEGVPGHPFQVNCTARHLEFDLSLEGILTGSRRPLRGFNIDGLTVDIRRNPGAADPSKRMPWPIFARLQADAFHFSAVNLHLENGITRLDVRDGILTGSELDAGIFSAREIAITSPGFGQTFANLRGATSWQESRLSIGALVLVRGLDIDTITIDLSRIAESRVGMEVNLDAFGGKIRVRVSSDDRDGKRVWDVAGNGSGVSLARMSDALEWESRASGSLHASKFTFRGELNDLRNATAALWAEVSGLTWRDRTADTVMIGASLYNREIQVEQLYIKQRNNQLTFSGEFGWPEKLSDWMQPAFHGDISASINDLGDFARLFGWSPSDFAGKLTASGNVSARERKLEGRLSVSGTSLVVFRSPIESLEIKLGLEDSHLQIEQVDLRQQEDFFHGEGDFALTGDRAYTATAQASVADLANYSGFIPSRFLPFALAGPLAVEWKGRGANGADSGSWHARGRNLHAVEDRLLPVDAEVAADYSPESIFFREFHLWNQRADLGMFVTVAKNYLHIQDVRLTLNGRPRLEGNAYLPWSLAKWLGGAPCLAALSADPFSDVDLSVDALDLAELAAAVKTKPDVSGQANGRIQFSGTPASLQGQTELHLHDFVWDASPPLSADLELQLALGMARIKANMAAKGSEPLRVEGNLPFRLEKRDPDYALISDGPLSATINFPAIFLGTLPSYLSRGVFTGGILSGNIAIADSVQHPLVTGGVSLVDGKTLRGPTLSAGTTFKGRTAAIDFVHLRESVALGAAQDAEPNFLSLDVSARGELDFSDVDDISLRVLPVAPVAVTAPGPGECVSRVEFAAGLPSLLPSRQAQELSFGGNIFTGQLRMSLPSANPVDPPDVFPFCQDNSESGKTVTLRVTPAFNP
jgi:hypothetical protein